MSPSFVRLWSWQKALTERGRPRPRERLPKERSSEGWMKRSGTLAEPSDNSSSHYIMQKTDPFGSASSHEEVIRLLSTLQSGSMCSFSKTIGVLGASIGNHAPYVSIFTPAVFAGVTAFLRTFIEFVRSFRKAGRMIRASI